MRVAPGGTMPSRPCSGARPIPAATALDVPATSAATATTSATTTASDAPRSAQARRCADLPLCRWTSRRTWPTVTPPGAARLMPPERVPGSGRSPGEGRERSAWLARVPAVPRPAPGRRRSSPTVPGAGGELVGVVEGGHRVRRPITYSLFDAKGSLPERLVHVRHGRRQERLRMGRPARTRTSSAPISGPGRIGHPPWSYLASHQVSGR